MWKRRPTKHCGVIVPGFIFEASPHMPLYRIACEPQGNCVLSRYHRKLNEWQVVGDFESVREAKLHAEIELGKLVAAAFERNK